MEFPNFNYAAKLFRIDRKQKTICRRLCAVRRRPGATRIAALVPRKTESRTVVRQLQVRGPKIEKNFKNRPTILTWRTRPWGIVGDLFEAKWSSSETFPSTQVSRKSYIFLSTFISSEVLWTLLHGMSQDLVHKKQKMIFRHSPKFPLTKGPFLFLFYILTSTVVGSCSFNESIQVMATMPICLQHNWLAIQMPLIQFTVQFGVQRLCLNSVSMCMIKGITIEKNRMWFKCIQSWGGNLPKSPACQPRSSCK